MKLSNLERDRARWFSDLCRKCPHGSTLSARITKTDCEAISRALLFGLLADQQHKKRRDGKMAYYIPPYERRLIRAALAWGARDFSDDAKTRDALYEACECYYREKAGRAQA